MATQLGPPLSDADKRDKPAACRLAALHCERCQPHRPSVSRKELHHSVIQRQYVTVTKLPGTADHRWHGVVNRYGPQTSWCRCAVRFGQMKRAVMPANTSLWRPAGVGGSPSGGGHHHHGSKTSADTTAAAGSNAAAKVALPQNDRPRGHRCQTSSKCHSGRTLSASTLELVAQQRISADNRDGQPTCQPRGMCPDGRPSWRGPRTSAVTLQKQRPQQYPCWAPGTQTEAAMSAISLW